MSKQSVLILCTENSARSQMAEGLLRHLGGDRFDVYSAGLNATGIHPHTHIVMNELGIDTSGQSSKDLSSYLGRMNFNYVIFVCHNAERNCPSVFPSIANRLSWPVEDPKSSGESEEEQLGRFRRARDELKQKISLWLSETKRATD